MRTRIRASALVLACVALVGAGTTTASAQEVDDLYAGANAVTATVSVLGTPIGSFAGTKAIAESAPLVDVASFGFQGPEGTPAVGASSALVDAVDAVVRDPQGDDLRCDIPDLAGLPVADLLSVLDVCSASEAALAGRTSPTGIGTAQAGALALNGQALADVIFDLILDPLMAQLDGVVVQVQGALTPLQDALGAICDELPRELSPTGLAEQANAIGLPVTDVIRALPEGEEILDALESDCLLSLDTLVDVVAAVPAIAESLVRDTLLGALDRDLLTITLGAARSSILSEGDTLGARSQLQAFEVTLPSLQFLLDAVEDLLTVQVQDVLAEVTSALPAELSAVTSQIPSLGEVLGPVLAQLDGLGIIDDNPLLQVSVASSVADARSLAGSSDVDTSASRAGGVAVKISPAIAGLLGIPAEVSAPAGQTIAIAEGTPLESVLRVGTVEDLVESFGGVQTAGARVTATEARLLTGLNGGIVVGTGVSEARVGGTLATPAPATPGETPTLPRTGSTDTATLLAGMGAVALLGAVLHLRRRVDAAG